MGYELNRFEGDVDEELVCPICSGVLEEPLQVRTLTLCILMNFSIWIHTMNQALNVVVVLADGMSHFVTFYLGL